MEIHYVANGIRAIYAIGQSLEKRLKLKLPEHTHTLKRSHTQTRVCARTRIFSQTFHCARRRRRNTCARNHFTPAQRRGSSYVSHDVRDNIRVIGTIMPSAWHRMCRRAFRASMYRTRDSVHYQNRFHGNYGREHAHISHTQTGRRTNRRSTHCRQITRRRHARANSTENTHKHTQTLESICSPHAAIFARKSSRTFSVLAHTEQRVVA